MTDDELLNDLPKVPSSTAAWLLLLWKQMEERITGGFEGLKSELTQQRGTLHEFEGRLEQVEEHQGIARARALVLSGIWKVVAALAAVGASVAIVISVVRPHG